MAAIEAERWLAEHGFPVPNGANVRLVMKPQRGLDDAAFKAEALSEITRWGTVLVGIGDRPEDAHAYIRHGIRPILLCSELYSPTRLREAVDGGWIVRDWHELRGLLQRLVTRETVRG